MGGCTAAGDLNDTQYSRPLPWIGLYVAAASLLCGAAMGFDAYSGFRRRQLWFPSRFFSINATTLTLLGIATKLPVDLNTSMPRAADQLTKLSGTVLICTTMGNFMPSLGAMDDSDSLSNVVALGILAVTVVVNVAIQMGTGVIYVFLPEHAIIMLLMMVLLVLLTSSALTVATTKQLLEKEYDSKYGQVSADADTENSGNSIPLPKLKTCVKRYWLMAHTCSPQYVLGRSATCTASGAFCLLAAGVLAQALLRAFIKGSDSVFCSGTSDYEWSSIVVLVAQAIAVLVGTVAPAYRWFNAVGFRSTEGRRWSCSDEFKVEVYWVQRLNEWKEAPLPFQLSSRWGRKNAHELKNAVMAVLVRLQAGVVLMSKFVRLASILPVSWISKSRRLFRKLESFTSSSHDGNVGLKDYVLYLEGEEDLVKLILRSERRDTDKWIEKGKRKQPTALLELINDCSTVSEGFKGAYAFDSDSVPSLIPEQQPPHCWALPVVTLVSIVIALPDIDQSKVDSLRNGVSEGLRYVRLIEKFLDAKGLVNMREAADKIWMSLDLYDRWFDMDLHNVVSGNKSGKEVVEAIRNIAKKSVLDFLDKVRTDSEANKNPLEWPGKVLAANCMYRVCTTILQDYDTKHKTDKNLLTWSQRTISDILGACLTNLPRVIYMECFCCRVEQREENVRDAAFLLGEAEKILEILGNPEVTCFFPAEKQYIDYWPAREMGP
ncbi:hypothetical protein Taro_010292 [Colocasia esculenta]|uniref:Uncharacterized protein n=1 Tax=Colocasia esculenta TaxID=4460 RepID=A0A843U790_COLES|nr:hypothetical protein [Colocasia esculenta]